MDSNDLAQDRDLWLLKWIFGLRKTQGILWLAEDVLTSQEGLYSVEF
jgi:hypothetical protein